QSAGRKACLAGKAGKHYCRSWRITPSVEKWRREQPHDTPPYPFMPSPTSANSSMKPWTLPLVVAAAILAVPVLTADAPYAGQQARPIKALSDDDIAALS